jgi:hypothetical protein
MILVTTLKWTESLEQHEEIPRVQAGSLVRWQTTRSALLKQGIQGLKTISKKTTPAFLGTEQEQNMSSSSDDHDLPKLFLSFLSYLGFDLDRFRCPLPKSAVQPIAPKTA